MRIARLLGSEMILLRAVDEVATAAFTEAQAYLDDVIDRTSDAHLHMLSRVLVGRPEQLISELVEAVGIELIAIATHGRSGLSRVVRGSVATHTLQQATVPLLIVRPSPTAAFTEGLHPTTSGATRSSQSDAVSMEGRR
jgi:nucleotide-binding universal stress UspA family protein